MKTYFESIGFSASKNGGGSMTKGSITVINTSYTAIFFRVERWKVNKNNRTIGFINSKSAFQELVAKHNLEI